MRAEGLRLDAEDPGWEEAASREEFDQRQAIVQTQVASRIPWAELAIDRCLSLERVDVLSSIFGSCFPAAYAANDGVNVSPLEKV